MSFKNLQSVIKDFEDRGQLVRISEPLSPKLEMTEVTDRVVKNGGPALLFENPQGYDIPVLTNLYGSLDRIRSIFNIQELDDLGAGFVRFLEMAPPKGWVEKLKLLPVLKEVADVFPKTIKNAPCQEVVHADDPDLAR
ncbi:MAG TPA: menaquinone biosynthesis decarboxylase, partial [Deltaproteobacteria bacterium]|nr:menaquinone biosynthesis decarboxylase [Deltaproteobacteria bacterium]